VSLAAGENDLSVDAGLYRKASVGDKVWEDTNHNWIQDSATDPGIGGVKVSLLDATGTTVLATTYTNASGNYLFSNLNPGDYILQFDKTNVIYRNTNMNIWKWAVKDVGSNDAIDSDVTGNGTSTTNVTRTDKFTLASGQNDMTRDAAITPIAIDLDGDGIHTVSRANSGGTFDLFGNGAGIHSGWLSGGDGFLAVDKNGNGAVDSIHELFGGMAKGAGFANLAAYDSNHDGVVDKSDANFADLLIWRDANGNHQTDAGELNSLAAHGIASLAVGYTEVPMLDAEGNLHLERSSATLADGSSVDMTDVYFNVSADDAAAAGVTLPTIGELLGNDASLDGLLSGLGTGAATPVMADNAVDTGAADALKQMAALYDQAAIAA
jgi:serine-aspartate repeat-containing protein C/D/E